MSPLTLPLIYKVSSGECDSSILHKSADYFFSINRLIDWFGNNLRINKLGSFIENKTSDFYKLLICLCVKILICNVNKAVR